MGPAGDITRNRDCFDIRLHIDWATGVSGSPEAMPPSLLRSPTAVDGQDCAGDVAGRIAREVDGCALNFL